MFVGRSWPEQFVARLIELDAKGLSTSLIAEEMGMSKNAIVGKRHRLGLSNKKKPKKTKPFGNKGHVSASSLAALKAIHQKTLSTAEQQKQMLENIMLNANDDDSRPGVLLGKLEWSDGRPSSCRAPLRGAGEHTLYCGAPVMAGKSFCAHHSARFFTSAGYRQARPDNPAYHPAALVQP